MMDAFAVALEARNPERNHFRSYRVEAGTDLLGDWIVEITFGRTGTFGTSIRHAVRNADEAKRLVHKKLQQRTSARKRIGCDYRLTALNSAVGSDESAWLPTGVMATFREPCSNENRELPTRSPSY